MIILISKLKQYFKLRNENILTFKLASSPKQQHRVMEKAGSQQSCCVTVGTLVDLGLLLPASPWAGLWQR